MLLSIPLAFFDHTTSMSLVCSSTIHVGGLLSGMQLSDTRSSGALGVTCFVSSVLLGARSLFASSDSIPVEFFSSFYSFDSMDGSIKRVFPGLKVTVSYYIFNSLGCGEYIQIGGAFSIKEGRPETLKRVFTPARSLTNDELQKQLDEKDYEAPL